MVKCWSLRVVVTLIAVAIPLNLGVRGEQAAGQTPSAPPSSSATAAPAAAVVQRYCLGCHNDRLKTGGLSLTAPTEETVLAHPDVWEKVIRKLRTGAMPPPGMPRPDSETSDRAAGWLESRIDQAAEANPDPGQLPNFQRLTRTEYANAVRDLLSLTSFPKDLDLSVLLPADNASSGFDNLRDLLFVSSTQLEQYLAAARKISRLVVGDPSMPVLIDSYALSEGIPQDEPIEGMPAGTRGGVTINTYLPLDGQYVLHAEISDPPRDYHELELSVDGARVGLFELSPAPPPAPTAAPTTAQTGTSRFQRDQLAEARRRAIAKGFDVTLPLKAGPRSITATFVRHSAALSEEVVIPTLRGRGGAPGISAVTIRGPVLDAGTVPSETPARRRLFVCRPTSRADEARCAKDILSTLARRAYRRPVNASDLDVLLPFYEAGRAEAGFDRGIQHALERLLVSPQFLFRIERDPAAAPAAGVYKISDIELASRLSFFLWSSIPDDELLDLAQAGTLSTPAILDAQVVRMLKDPRSRTLTTNFAAQWLFLRDVEGMHPNPVSFPHFNEGLRSAFQRETELFVDSVFREDRSLLSLLTANYTFLNGRLAKHYGVPNVYGADFQRVEWPANSPRRGLLGQGSILMLTSHATRTSPVLRGKYVLDNLLASPPPPPPPNIPALEEQSSDGKPLSVREALAKHRAHPVCASCHSRMDPLGFALENFDGIGRWRVRDESGTVIDSSGTLPDGTALSGVDSLRQYLVNRPEPFVMGATEKLLTYAVGRRFAHIDVPAVRQIVRSAAPTDYRLSSLVIGVVNSVPFRMRKTATPAAASSLGTSNR